MVLVIMPAVLYDIHMTKNDKLASLVSNPDDREDLINAMSGFKPDNETIDALIDRDNDHGREVMSILNDDSLPDGLEY
jgi:hypothetical protein